jgi:sugar phosphate isomerase/epimerase
MTLDVGHVARADVPAPVDLIERYADLIFNVHLHDYNDQTDHLALGTGHLNLPPILAALRRIDYDGLLMLELSPQCGTDSFLASRDTVINWLTHSRRA